MKSAVPDTKIIKESLQLRAKYTTKKQASKQNLRCVQVVPHPSNRGGEVIRTARTKALAGDILEAGYDPVEATLQLVAVEIDVDSSGHPTTRFSDHFKNNAGMDPDHYYDPNYNVLFAGLSHNSKNITERNMSNAMPGCACDPPTKRLEDCKCKVKPILDDTCRYDMSKVKKADQDWYNAIVGGTEWEILSSDMDREEPNAAHIIALALNQQKPNCIFNCSFGNLENPKIIVQPRPQVDGGSVRSSKGPDAQVVRCSCRRAGLLSCLSIGADIGRQRQQDVRRVFQMGELFRRRV